MRPKASAPFAVLCCYSLVSALSVVATNAMAAAHPRPKITGISHIALYTSDPQATKPFYVESIGAVREDDPEDPRGVRYAINATQFVEALPLPANSGINRMD